MVLHPDSKEITTHHTPRCPRRFTRMNYVTNSAAEIFQKEISEALDGLEGVLNIRPVSNVEFCMHRMQFKQCIMRKPI